MDQMIALPSPLTPSSALPFSSSSTPPSPPPAASRTIAHHLPARTVVPRLYHLLNHRRYFTRAGAVTARIATPAIYHPLAVVLSHRVRTLISTAPAALPPAVQLLRRVTPVGSTFTTTANPHRCCLPRLPYAYLIIQVSFSLPPHRMTRACLHCPSPATRPFCDDTIISFAQRCGEHLISPDIA